MKICLIDPSLFTWPYDARLCRGLAENGHDAVIYGRTPSAPLPAAEDRLLRRHFYPGLEAPIIRRLPHALFLGLKGLSHAESMLRLVRQLRRWRPDIVHFQWTPLAVIDKRFIAAFRQIAPTILTIHDSAPFNNSPRAGLQRLGAIDIMRRFDRVIVHTAAAQARVASYGIPAETISRIPHGLLLDLDLEEIARANRARTEERVTLLLFGQIKPYKGTDVLLHAVSRLPEPLRRICRVRIVGRPQMSMEPLFALVEELGIQRQIEFDLRFIPDTEIPDLLLSADIQLFPYREIDASGVLMLALATGRPIVASNIGLFGELLEDGRHGALVAPGDPDALAQALASLVADRERRQAIGDAVLDLRNNIPRWSEIAQQTEQCYQLAIARGQGHRRMPARLP